MKFLQFQRSTSTASSAEESQSGPTTPRWLRAQRGLQLPEGSAASGGPRRCPQDPIVGVGCPARRPQDPGGYPC